MTQKEFSGDGSVRTESAQGMPDEVTASAGSAAGPDPAPGRRNAGTAQPGLTSGRRTDDSDSVNGTVQKEPAPGRRKAGTGAGSAVQTGYRLRQKRYFAVTLLLAVITAVLVCVSMIYGNTIYSPSVVLRVLSGEDVDGAVFTIRTLRFPRMLAALLAGAAFGMAGNTFQKLLGNPLASPDIIGVTSGSSVAAVVCILVLDMDGAAVSAWSVLAGLLTAALIYLLSLQNGFSNTRLILVGIGARAFLSAVISWLLLKASEYDVASAMRWLSGSLNGVQMDQIPVLAVVVLVSAAAIAVLNRALEVMQLGVEHAVTMGVRVGLVRVLLIGFSLLMVACATAVTGPIASVSFLAGPIAMRLTGGGRTNMAASALTGTILVLLSDLVGQYALPARYPVGVITGILGAPYLLYLLIRMSRQPVKEQSGNL